MRKFTPKARPGFTLIEAMVGIVIVTIGVASMLTGVVQAHNILRSAELKERAFEELRAEAELWKGMIAYGQLTAYQKSGDLVGKAVDLEDNPRGKIPMRGTITREPIKLVPDGFTNIPRYELTVSISWMDYTMLSKSRTREMSLTVVMSELPI